MSTTITETIDAIVREWSVTRSHPLRDRIVSACMPMVRALASRRNASLPPGSIVDADDLASVGAMAVVEALSRFDAGRGVRFATFAAQRVRGAMLDHLRLVDYLNVHQRRAVNSGLRPDVSHVSTALEVDAGDGHLAELGDLIPDKSTPLTTADRDAFDFLIRGIGRIDTLIARSRFCSDLALKDIGTAIGISEAAVCNRLKRLVDHARERAIAA